MTERVLHRDYETRSVLDLRKVGAHVYAKHASTDVLLACFAFDDEEPFEWRPGQPLPFDVLEHIAAGGRVEGFNAAFEAAVDEAIMGPRYDFPVPKPEQLDCAMARCAIQSLPLDLERACKALGLQHQKDKEGHRLMLRMCRPRKPRKGEDKAKIYWVDDERSLERLGTYCAADIRAERALGKALAPMTADERAVWLLDFKMNNRGVAIDRAFVAVAQKIAALAEERGNAELAEVTGGAVQKVTQVDRLKDFAKANGVVLKIVEKTRRNGEEYKTEAADKEAIEDLLAGELPPAVRQAFEIRLAGAKSSTKKLIKFADYSSVDGRSRGNLQYHAAGPGRWAGRGIQLQNLPRKGVEEPGGWEAAARELVKLAALAARAEDDLAELREIAQEESSAAFDLFELCYGSPLDLLSRMLRGCVVAAPGKKLYFADYSQVEARGCVWAARQDDQVELFARGGKIYEEMAAAIFGLSVDEVLRLHKTKENIIPRFVGKETVLGCGYGMGAGAFQRNAKKKGKIILPIEICEKGVYGWREQNPRVVEFWRELEDAAKAAIENPGQVFRAGPFSYRVRGRWLQCRLPSGRVIWYRRPSIKPDAKDIAEYGGAGHVPRFRWKIHYWGVNGVTKQWQEETTWGGKLLENAIQGACRDMLAGAKLRLEAAGYPIILSVHDEAIAEADEDFGSVDEFLALMTQRPSWAQRFPLKAEGGVGIRYAK